MAQTPSFLLETLAAQYAPSEVQRILAGYACRRLTTLRVNRLKAEPDTVREALAQAGIAVQPVLWSEDALILPDAQEETLSALPLYARGEIYLQNLSAMLPALMLGAKPGECVLDMAAAPGGKTTQIAALTGNGALITACERSKARAERLKFNVQRQGAARVTVMNMDARQMDDLFRFDRVLLDAPCSGSGTVTANSRGQFSREYLSRTVNMQRTLLEKAMRLVKPGCEMVYSTCSILREENEEVVCAVMKKTGAQLVPLSAPDGVPMLHTTLAGTLCVCPDACYEGFFVAKLRRVR